MKMADESFGRAQRKRAGQAAQAVSERPPGDMPTAFSTGECENDDRP
jgi:hypothetical protein